MNLMENLKKFKQISQNSFLKNSKLKTDIFLNIPTYTKSFTPHPNNYQKVLRSIY